MYSLAWGSDSRLLVSASQDGRLILWDTYVRAAAAAGTTQRLLNHAAIRLGSARAGLGLLLGTRRRLQLGRYTGGKRGLIKLRSSWVRHRSPPPFCSSHGAARHWHLATPPLLQARIARSEQLCRGAPCRS